jgi:hypothetical protein
VERRKQGESLLGSEEDEVDGEYKRESRRFEETMKEDRKRGEKQKAKRMAEAE